MSVKSEVCPWQDWQTWNGRGSCGRGEARQGRAVRPGEAGGGEAVLGPVLLPRPHVHTAAPALLVDAGHHGGVANCRPGQLQTKKTK